MIRRRGQSLLEYSILLIIVIAAFLTMQTYLKRGIQGRWKTSVDDLGEQYDPGYTHSLVRHTLDQNSETRVSVEEDVLEGKDGFFTLRQDKTLSRETRNGTTTVDNP